MTENVADDPDFWMNAGLDYIHRTWKNSDIISLEDMTALEKIFVQQGAPNVVPEEHTIEKKCPGLIRT